MATIYDEPQQRGRAFVEFALAETLKQAQNGRKDKRIVEWTRNRIAENGEPKSMKGRAEILYREFCKIVAYIEDPYDCEWIAKARDVMCLPEADLCLKGGDCEEQAHSLASVFGAAGLQTCLIHQKFKRSNHAIVGVLTEDGWVRADTSYHKELGDTLGSHYKAVWERWIDTMTGTTLHTGDGTTVPGGPVSDYALLAGKPLHDFVSINGLGASDQSTAEQLIVAWGPWLEAANKEMNRAYSAASDAAQALQKTREALKLPQYDPDGSAGWTAAASAAFYGTVATAVKDLDDYATQALAGTRKAAWHVDAAGQGSLALVQMPGDQRVYGLDSTGALSITDIAATPGGGLGGLVAELADVALSVTAVGVYLNVTRACQTYQQHLEAQRERDLATTTNNLLKSGASMDDVRAFLKAATPPAASTSLSELPSLLDKLVTGVVVVAGIGVVLYVGEKYLEARARAA